ncbi:Ribose-phosphate pyrophosphokinase, partial [hydrothermal vent metagenome]
MRGMPSTDADNRLMVFSGNANPPLAQAIANHLRLNLG